MKLTKKIESGCGALVAGVFLLAGLACAQVPVRQVGVVQSIPGQAVNGLQLSIRRDPPESGRSAMPRFRVELRNVGAEDLLLNLGIVASASGRQYPTAVSLVLVDSKGESQRLELKRFSPSNAPGTKPLLLPLPAGASFSFPVDLRNYWALGHKEFNPELKAGTYWLEAHFARFPKVNYRGWQPSPPGIVLVSEPRQFDTVGHPEPSGNPTSTKLQFEITR